MISSISTYISAPVDKKRVTRLAPAVVPGQSGIPFPDDLESCMVKADSGMPHWAVWSH